MAEGPNPIQVISEVITATPVRRGGLRWGIDCIYGKGYTCPQHSSLETRISSTRR